MNSNDKNKNPTTQTSAPLNLHTDKDLAMISTKLNVKTDTVSDILTSQPKSFRSVLKAADKRTNKPRKNKSLDSGSKFGEYVH